ncbi:hypothetical protein M422DRAFT_244983 [Sphaerobolus stellatus SS14]|nr:hypothetical protein M422DRAFT_244983 [Sphaerobolus stellatus SS14]
MYRYRGSRRKGMMSRIVRVKRGEREDARAGWFAGTERGRRRRRVWRSENPYLRIQPRNRPRHIPRPPLHNRPRRLNTWLHDLLLHRLQHHPGLREVPRHAPPARVDERAPQAGGAVVSAGYGGYGLDVYLKYVPAWFSGANFKRIAAAARERADRSREMTFRQVKLQLDSGNDLPSFMGRSLVELGKDLDDDADEDVDAIKSVVGGIFGDGKDRLSVHSGMAWLKARRL